MTAREVFLLMLKDAGGRISGKTLIQKRAFFLDLFLDIGLGYLPHYYGPYSPIVETAIGECKALGFVTEKVTGYSAVSKKGFEVKRFDYELTEDGNIVANAICARDKEQATEIQNCLERLNKAGELDYVELSIAAKAIFILQDGHKPMSPGEIAEQAKRFKWDISREAVDGAVEFLSRLGLVS